MMVEISLDQQITELKAELAIRRNAYRAWIAAGRMKQETGDRKFAAMTAALHTLMEVQAAWGSATFIVSLESIAKHRMESGLP